MLHNMLLFQLFKNVFFYADHCILFLIYIYQSLPTVLEKCWYNILDPHYI